MLGYITINRDDLKVKDLDVYQSFYCGICHDIKARSGQLARFTLSYDMTFLAMVLTGLYDEKLKRQKRRCMLHPLVKKTCVSNKYTEYAADMCVILTYHNLMDDWHDEKKRKSVFYADVIRKSYKKAASKYPRQTKAVIKYIRKLHKVEKSKDYNIDLASGLTGEMFKEIFTYNEDDIWSRDLSALGFYLGKFIYLMDAYDDVYEDRRTGNYNPFIKEAGREDFEQYAKSILIMMISEASRAFERLPVVDFVDILRNILYSGVWSKYWLHQNRKERRKKTEG
jgi:hypothetical protein